ncbi:hypothetical protein AMJ87_06955 [candidate division WOR_3 bacterium SM23_60]|uniref:L,D-TPase catalytic domain-containing protein n=1 Tax=candidate division WOR_3 bacterium SM23_60 TaxID=1703780 RepID=A0A0S8GF34_UNCW3|nr:MAG: hypothetical protein AMJ87_06955 [candidate division WOR_3 bacterium SM23_60]
MTRARKYASRVKIAVFLVLLIASSLSARPIPDQIQEFLRTRIESADIQPIIVVGDERIYASIVLPQFYERRGYWPAWCDDKGISSQVDALIDAINDARLEGLEPRDYHLTLLERTRAELQADLQKKFSSPLDQERFADFDLLITDAFLIYASHLLAGRINPETIDPEWRANRREADLADVLQKALDTHKVKETLRELLPEYPGYWRLRSTLPMYREIAASGGWPVIPEGPAIKKGETGEHVVVLCERLRAEGYLSTEECRATFDEATEAAVKQFQKCNGLDSDGVVGAATRAALNVPASERVKQILVNLERWRWLPQELGNRCIIINIANFELDVVEENETVLNMRAVVGRAYRRTPVFTDRMTYIVLNPYWNVPRMIATKDILPLIKKDVTYLTKQNIRVLQGVGASQVEIDPHTVDWTEVTENNFTYTFRQDPGPTNALGRMKFMFPNKYNVYIHDTPAIELFAKAERGFSSGCIRIERPFELAEYLLKGDTYWTKERLRSAIRQLVTQTIRLQDPIFVHLLYWTTWLDDDGSIQFRYDIYGRDQVLHDALREKPPGASNNE